MDVATEKVLTLLDRLDLASSDAKRAATIERQRREELQRHCVHPFIGEERYEHREFAGYHAPRLICLVCGIEHQSDADGTHRMVRCRRRSMSGTKRAPTAYLFANTNTASLRVWPGPPLSAA
jgi:hypothetical protein